MPDLGQSSGDEEGRHRQPDPPGRFRVQLSFAEGVHVGGIVNLVGGEGGRPSFFRTVPSLMAPSCGGESRLFATLSQPCEHRCCCEPLLRRTPQTLEHKHSESCDASLLTPKHSCSKHWHSSHFKRLRERSAWTVGSQGGWERKVKVIHQV